MYTFIYGEAAMKLLNKRLDEKFQPHLPGFKSDYDYALQKHYIQHL